MRDARIFARIPIEVDGIIRMHHVCVLIFYYCCPVNASNSINIKMFEWYKPHSLDDSPERGLNH